MGTIVQCGGGSPSEVPRRKVRIQDRLASANGKAPTKAALVLGGGGIAGAAFEVGAMLALNDALTDFKVNDFHMYVGTSAGAFLSACLANGITPETFARSQLGTGPSDVPGISRRQILKPIRGKLGRRELLWARAIRQSIVRLAKRGFNTSAVDAFFTITQGLSSWRLYTTTGLEEYLRVIFSKRGRSN